MPDITTAQATDIDERSVTSSLCCGWLVPVVFLFESWQRPTATQMFTEGGVWFATMGSLIQNSQYIEEYINFKYTCIYIYTEKTIVHALMAVLLYMLVVKITLTMSCLICTCIHHLYARDMHVK